MAETNAGKSSEKRHVKNSDGSSCEPEVSTLSSTTSAITEVREQGSTKRTKEITSGGRQDFDIMSQRSGESESCASQITVSSSSSIQHEFSSSSTTSSSSNFIRSYQASILHRLEQALMSDFTPLDFDYAWENDAKDGIQNSVEHYSVPLVQDAVIKESKRGDDVRVVVQKEMMFSIVLTPSNVGELNRLIIPNHHAEKYLPNFSYPEQSLLLDVEDPVGKPWLFLYSYCNSSRSHVLTEGWNYFVKENVLHAGDTVSFYRGVGVGKGENKLFISCIKQDVAHDDDSIDQYIDWDSIPHPPFDMDGVTVDDALLYCGLFPPDHEFQKDWFNYGWHLDFLARSLWRGLLAYSSRIV